MYQHILGLIYAGGVALPAYNVEDLQKPVYREIQPSKRPSVSKLRWPAKWGGVTILERHQNSRWWRQRSLAWKKKRNARASDVLPKNVIHGSQNLQKNALSQSRRKVQSIFFEVRLGVLMPWLQLTPVHNAGRLPSCEWSSVLLMRQVLPLKECPTLLSGRAAHMSATKQLTLAPKET